MFCNYNYIAVTSWKSTLLVSCLLCNKLVNLCVTLGNKPWTSYSILRNKLLNADTSDVIRPTGVESRYLQIQLHIFPFKLTDFEILIVWLGSRYVWEETSGDSVD